MPPATSASATCSLPASTRSTSSVADVHPVGSGQPCSPELPSTTADVSQTGRSVLDVSGGSESVLPDASSVEVEQSSSVLDGQGIELNTESNKVEERAGTLSTNDVSNVLTCSRFYSSSSCQRMPRMRKTVSDTCNAVVCKRSQRKTTKPARYQ